jgi:DNA segregation ATPase FtsK/SpoIIIE-like protein
MENKDISVLFRRLIRKSRKAGLFMFAMGTSWKHTDMDTSTRRQFLTKIHFMASDKDSSKTLLGDTRASELRDRGRAFGRFSFSASPDLVELQSAYIDKAQAMAALAEVGQGPAIGGGDDLPPVSVPASIFDLPVAPDEPTPREQIILDMFDDGASLNQISKAINDDRTGGKYNEEIKATVKKFKGTDL